ncbi:pTS system, fructose-specific IIABC component [Elysia marginata]|uniref:PTS system, fructose-specific IIABC component n=1 Tax=Elysia marginata TaxID=1093978 RepID=A0AAV4FPL4_9GAST|nr:pTS system, fructose-specific IIABC component [Elysia marginata]
MLPFIVAGGIILGIGFLIDLGNSGGALGVTRDAARWFSGLGKLGLGIFVPVLGGYVAYSIVGAEGLLPGFIAGIIASGGGLLYGGSNFIETFKETSAGSGIYTKVTESVSG